MKTIPLLRNALHDVTRTRSPHDIFRSYRGTDWKDYVQYSYGGKYCYPHVLWQNDSMELVIMGWADKQTYHTYTNYNTIYSRVLQGALFFDEINADKTRTTWFMQESSFLKIYPFSIITMTAARPTVASLHLFTYSYQK